VTLVDWLRLRAAEGSARAQYELAVRYRDGNGVPKDLVEAKRLLEQSAQQGLEKASGLALALSAVTLISPPFPLCPSVEVFPGPRDFVVMVCGSPLLHSIPPPPSVKSVLPLFPPRPGSRIRGDANITNLYNRLTCCRHRAILPTMKSDLAQLRWCTCPSVGCAAVRPPPRLDSPLAPGLLSNLKSVISNPIPLLLEPAFVALVAFCGMLYFRLSPTFSLLPSSFGLSKDPSHSRKDLSLKPEYPPLSQNIPPYPVISPPPFFMRNHPHDNEIPEHNINPLKTACVHYQPLAHSKIFHRISALLAPGSALGPPRHPRRSSRSPALPTARTAPEPNLAPKTSFPGNIQALQGSLRLLLR